MPARSRLADHPETSEAGQKAKADAEKADADVAGQVAEKADADTARGFRGVEVDPTPNEHYTVAGVTAGKPTPETDPGAAAEAHAAARNPRA